MVTAVAVGATSQPSSTEPERGSEGDLNQRKENGQDRAQTDKADLSKKLKTGVRKPGQCVPKVNVTPEINIKWEGMDAHIQYMKDHALIAKFIGIYPLE